MTDIFSREFKIDSPTYRSVLIVSTNKVMKPEALFLGCDSKNSPYKCEFFP